MTGKKSFGAVGSERNSGNPGKMSTLVWISDGAVVVFGATRRSVGETLIGAELLVGVGLAECDPEAMRFSSWVNRERRSLSSLPILTDQQGLAKYCSLSLVFILISACPTTTGTEPT